LKRERKTENPVDEGKVRELSKAIRAAGAKK
jgi:predicted TIM-barrel enzyme